MLTVVAILCAAGGLAEIGFAFFALHRQKQAQCELENVARSLSEALKKRLESGWPEETDGQERAYADIGAAADYVRALGDLGAKLGGMTPPVAALLIASLPFAFAVGLAVLSELHG
ncbi:MAG TPA: hypothetical protein VF081_01190 [Solirubrobacterales bacterium]